MGGVPKMPGVHPTIECLIRCPRGNHVAQPTPVAHASGLAVLEERQIESDNMSARTRRYIRDISPFAGESSSGWNRK
jgi:hypothetical protein